LVECGGRVRSLKSLGQQCIDRRLDSLRISCCRYGWVVLVVSGLARSGWLLLVKRREVIFCVHAVSDDSNGEDCHGEGIAAIERVAAKQLGDGLVVVF